ncbi:glycosyltransferase, partial [Thiogranum longum]
MKTRRPILIMAGGTGGHVFPALAVAEQLRVRNWPVVWMGTHVGLEARVVPAAGIPIHYVKVSGLRGKGVLRLFVAPFMLAWAALQATGILLTVRPCAVLGMGGFATGPGGVMAWLLRRPLIIHEQNSVAGLTNRLLAPLAKVVLEAFPGSLKKAVHTGNPVRSSIAGIHFRDPDMTSRRPRLLVVGGSLGAA